MIKNTSIEKRQQQHHQSIHSQIKRNRSMIFFKKKPKPQEVISFSRQLATLLLAGISITEALTVILKGLSKGALVPIIQAIKQKIEQGHPLSSALRQFPTTFNRLYCGLIEVGEISGTLDGMLEQIATYQEKSDALKRKIRSMMFYPCLVLILGSFVFIYLLTTVVPTFKDLFDSLHVALPAITRLLLTLSYFLNNYGLMALLILLFFIVGIAQFYKKNLPFKTSLDRFSLKIPLLGHLLTLSSIVTFSRTFATTQAAGIPVDNALEVLSLLLPNAVFSTAVQQVKDKVSEGRPIHQAMASSEIFPPFLVQMIAIGEKSGTLERMLKTVAVLYEEKLETRLAGLTTLIEPIMMLILGVGVGGLVIAIYLPIFKMGALF